MAAEELIGNQPVTMKRSTYRDPVIEAYIKDVDLTLLRENLKLTHAQRMEKFVKFMKFTERLQSAGNKARKKSKR